MRSALRLTALCALLPALAQEPAAAPTQQAPDLVEAPTRKKPFIIEGTMTVTIEAPGYTAPGGRSGGALLKEGLEGNKNGAPRGRCTRPPLPARHHRPAAPIPIAAAAPHLAPAEGPRPSPAEPALAAVRQHLPGVWWGGGVHGGGCAARDGCRDHNGGAGIQPPAWPSRVGAAAQSW